MKVSQNSTVQQADSSNRNGSGNATAPRGGTPSVKEVKITNPEAKGAEVKKNQQSAEKAAQQQQPAVAAPSSQPSVLRSSNSTGTIDLVQRRSGKDGANRAEKKEKSVAVSGR